MRTQTLALIAAVMASPALSAPAATPAPPTTVAPVTVYPRTDPPKLAATYPAADQAVAAGVMVVTLRFDQPMGPGFEITPAPAGAAPRCLPTPRLLNDGKTFALLCTTAPRQTYALAFNAGPKGGFANLAEQRAQPAALTFTTTGETGPRDVPAAMKAAGLTPLDVPIQDSPLPGVMAR